MLDISALVILVLSVCVVIYANHPSHSNDMQVQDCMHRMVCVGLFAVGCVLRLLQLTSLPAGVAADEALVGVQAKTLWQTGGYFPDGRLTTYFEYWKGEQAGTLLAALTAPFVGMMGMNAFSVRVPLALLSCASMPAAYGLGKELAGKRAARWCLMAYALCPYFVLCARMTNSANAAVYLAPVALYLLVSGVKRPCFLYGGAAVVALMAYAQMMYLWISPAVIVIAAIVYALYGGKKRHALGAAALGLTICLPGIMTLWVSISESDAITLFGVVDIPVLDTVRALKEKNGVSVGNLFAMSKARMTIKRVWQTIIGCIFQIIMHDNISSALFAPVGMLALYAVSVPLMILGAVSLAVRRVDGKMAEKEYIPGRMMICLFFAAALWFVVLYGSDGVAIWTGTTSVYDYSAIFCFDVLLMAAGLCRIERKSRVGIAAMCAIFCTSVVMLIGHLFGGSYQMNANVYFGGFREAAWCAGQIQESTHGVVNVTNTVYPHIQPSEAAEMMYLYASDADMRETVLGELKYEVIYPRGIDNPDPEQVYLVTAEETVAWDIDAFDYEDYGQYVILRPKRTK